MKNAIISGLLCFEYYRACTIKSLAITVLFFFVVWLLLYECDDLTRKGVKWIRQNLQR